MSCPRSGKPPKALANSTPDLEHVFSKQREDPTALFETLRNQCPVALQGGAGHNGRSRAAWLLTRYEDIVAAARDPERFGQSVRFEERRRPPLEANPPEHRRWRSRLQRFFLPKALNLLVPRARAICDEAIAPLLAAGGGDLAEAIARPLPPKILLAWMNQPETDWLDVKRACEAAYLQSSTDPQDQQTYRDADALLWRYAEAAVESRVAGGHDPATDPIAALLAEDEGERLDRALVIGAVRLLLAAGHDSTTSAIGICLHYVASDLALQDRLRAEPKLIPAAIEEILRLRPPVLLMPRTMQADTVVRDRTLEDGDSVLLMFASGNLDAEAFPDAQTFKLDRSPNRHLSFGTGIHTCIGNTLARQEIRVALEALLEGTRSIRLDGEPEHEFWHPFGIVALPVTLEPS